MKKVIFVSLMLVLAGLTLILCYNLNNDVDDKMLVRDDIIRLHIIANSDSPSDQTLKLKVRDELLSAFSDIFKGTKDLGDAKARIIENASQLDSVAQDKVYSEGYSYSIRTELGIDTFPTKVYGSEVYPAGSYNALKVIIGQGSGANWWCVMFPPLCFVDISSQVSVDESTGDDDTSIKERASSQENLDDNELGLIDGEALEIETTTEYKFKVAEWWHSFKNWIKGIFS